MTKVFDSSSFVKTLPPNPGVYKMYADKVLLYVGKAKNLSKRVPSYFKDGLPSRLSKMVQQITHIDLIVLPTEIDALVLESQLIKQENPKYNIQLKDDRGFPYLVIDTRHEFPSLFISTRKIDGAINFGPFPSRHDVRQAFVTLKNHFQLRTCSDTFFKNRSRPCLEYQMGRCTAPCVGKVSVTNYQNQAQELTAVLQGKSDDVVALLVQQMNEASEKMNYEQAAQLRNKITSIRHVQSKITVDTGGFNEDVVSVASKNGQMVGIVLSVRDGKIISTKTYRFSLLPDTSSEEILSDFLIRYLSSLSTLPVKIVIDVHKDTLNFLNDVISRIFATTLVVPLHLDEKSFIKVAENSAAQSLNELMSAKDLRLNQLKDLQEMFHLEKLPQLIECFDISHMQGQDTIASKVAFGSTGSIKKMYRRYKIEKTNGDDLLAMKLALTRRFSKKEHLPDVLLIDGGELQVLQALEVLKEYHLEDIPCIGVAKGPKRIEGEETLVHVQTGEQFSPGPRSPALMFIQAVRNEAHRFAIEGHRKQRNKRMVHSVLEDVPGVGPAKRKVLLEHFGGLEGLKKATIKDLSSLEGIGEKLAQLIFDILRR